MPQDLYIQLAKILGVVAIVGALYGAGYYHGQENLQEEWDADQARQIAKAAQDQYAVAQNTARIEAEYQHKLREQSEQVRIVEKEVIRYVKSPTKKCPVSPELERAHDAVTSLYDSTIHADDLPSTPSPTGASIDSPAGGLQIVAGNTEQPLDDSVMLEAYADALMEYARLWEVYDALRSWVRTSYALQVEAAGQ